MLEDKSVKKLTMIHGEIDSGSYNSHRIVYSDKKSFNIDCLVNNVISKRYAKHKFRRVVKKKPPIQGIVAIGFILVMLLALIPQILPPLYGDFGSDVIVSLDPDDVYLNETLFVNVSIPSSYNITNVSAVMASIDTISLQLVDNTSLLHLWSGNWTVFGLTPGEHIITVSALDDINSSYSASFRLSVISDNESYEPEKNETNPPDDMNDENISKNETIIPVGLNLSLQCDKSVYIVNETVKITGIAMFNNSLINTSVNVSISGPGLNLSDIINVTIGRFDYQFAPVAIGSYVIQTRVTYLNESVEEELLFDILSIPLENVYELYIWDDTDYNVKYVGEQITFYANYSYNTLNILNATCLISFNISGWTEPAFMSLSDDYYVYSRSFDKIGTNQFRVWCSAQEYENKSLVSEFVVSRYVSNVSDVSIVDSKLEEHVYVLPGTSFYVERTVDGLNGADVVFAPLFFDGLKIEKFEIIHDNETTDFDVVREISPQKFVAGKGVSNVERRIDNILNKLPINLKELNSIYCSRLFSLDGPTTVRIWFKAPTWEEINIGIKPSSGRISYLTFTDTDFDYESSTWWNSNWDYRKLITINSSQVADDLKNFPMLVNITDSDLASRAQSDGDDIAFVLWSDNNTQLNHEIESFNSVSGNLVAWVNVTSLSSTVDTKIWMYYSNSECNNQQNSAGVWDSNYVLVQHLNETSGIHYDSTNYGNNGTNYNSNQNVGGIIDGANQFDGTNDWIQISDDPSLEGMQQLTIEAWIFDTGNDANPRGIVSKRVSSGSQRSFSLFLWSGRNINFDIGTDRDVTSSTVTANQWYYFVATFDGSLSSQRKKYYFDGSYDSSDECSPTSVPSTSSDLHIGILNANYGNGWAGIIDEVRISNIIRNSSWMTTTYNTVVNTSTFISLGSEEYGAPIVSTPIPSDGFTGISVPPTSFNITISDLQGDNMNITWRTNASGYWVTFNVTDGGGSGVGDGTYSATNTSWVTSHSTKYWWSVNVSDDTIWTNETYSFTTNYEPQLSSPDPANGSTSVITPICSITVSDQDGGTVTVRFYENTTGPWVLQQTNGSVDVSSPALVVWDYYSNASTPNTKYWWKVNATDGSGGYHEEIYHFTTSVNNPPDLSYENPIHLLTGVPTSLSAVNITIADEDGDPMDWSIETSPNIGSNSGNNEGNGSKSCSILGLIEGTIYYWYVNVTDGIMWTNETYSFTTSYKPTIELIIPSPNGTTDVNLQPICQIWANDTDGENLNVTWAHNISGSYVDQYTNVSVTANSIVTYKFTDFTNYSKKYYWKVYVNDSSSNVSKWFYFTTLGLSTSVDPISPYIQTSSPLQINATGSSTLSNVSLWYSYSEDNSTWWNISWLKRKPIYLNVSSGSTPMNYQVLLNITYDSDMKNDFSDIRFVNSSGGINVLDYWIEDKSDGNWALVWVEIDGNITTINKTLAWLYYGNSDASSASNGTKTFILFDDFLGSTYDDTIWGTNAVEGTEYTISSGILEMWGAWNSGGGDHYFATDNSFNSPIIAQSRARISSVSSDMDLCFGFQNSQTTEWWTDTNCVWCLFDGNGGGSANAKTIKTGGTSDTGNEATSTTWETHIIEYLSGTANWYDSNLGWLNSSRSTYSPFYFSLAGDSDSASKVYVDYVFLRNYSSVIPNYSIGSEDNWIEWNNINNPDLNTPWSWNFDFPNGTGYYEFYSIGKKSGSNDERIPSTADTKCYLSTVNTSIEITPDQWDIGTTTIGNYNYSTSDFYFNLTNEGDVALDIQIKASNATNSTTGAKWILNETPDFNNYSLQYNKSGGGTWTNINLTFDTFVTDLIKGSWQTFDLNIFMAKTSTKSDPLSITVTFRSVPV